MHQRRCRGNGGGGCCPCVLAACSDFLASKVLLNSSQACNFYRDMFQVLRAPATHPSVELKALTVMQHVISRNGKVVLLHVFRVLDMCQSFSPSLLLVLSLSYFV